MAAHVKNRPMTGLEDIRPKFRDGALARIMRAGRYWEDRARAGERVRRLDGLAVVAAIVAGYATALVHGGLAWVLWQWFVR